MNKRLLSIFLAVNILSGSFSLTSCSRNNDNLEMPNLTSEIVTESVDMSIDSSTESDTECSGEYIDSLKEKIDSIQPIYLNEEYYPTAEELENDKELANTYYDCPMDEDLSPIEIYECIRNNTIERFGNNTGVFFSTDNMTDDESEMYCNLEHSIIEALYNIFSNRKNDYKEDICKFKNLSILVKDLNESEPDSEERILGQYVPELNVIYIDYNALIEALESINEARSKTDDDEMTLDFLLTSTIEHELGHASQDLCEHRIENGDEGKKVELYGDYVNFILESSAESALYNYNGSAVEDIDSYTYFDYRESEALLLLLAAFKENRNLDQYYESIFDCNINNFWEFFGINDDDDLKKFSYILYALNTIHERTELVWEKVDEGTIITKADIISTVGNSYLIDMMKIITKDIIDSTERDSLSIDDSLLLYLLVKSYIVDESKLPVKDGEYSYNREYDEEFAKLFKEIETIYKEYLCKKFNTSVEDIDELINSSEMELSLLTITLYFRGKNKNPDIDSYPKILKLQELYPILPTIISTRFCYPSEYKKFDEYFSSIGKGTSVLKKTLKTSGL